MTEAARETLKRRAGLTAIEEWEKEHGRFTEEEMAQAHRRVSARMNAPAGQRRKP
jgi:hypothetical protein